MSASKANASVLPLQNGLKFHHYKENHALIQAAVFQLWRIARIFLNFLYLNRRIFGFSNFPVGYTPRPIFVLIFKSPWFQTKPLNFDMSVSRANVSIIPLYVSNGLKFHNYKENHALIRAAVFQLFIQYFCFFPTWISISWVFRFFLSVIHLGIYTCKFSSYLHFWKYLSVLIRQSGNL